MLSLDEIAIAHQTDKATRFTRTYAKPKGYTVHYEMFFAPLRDRQIKLLEIGVGSGESIRTWLDYFSKAHVYGIDFVQNTNEWNTPGIQRLRYAFSHGDQTDRTMWLCFLANWGYDWDVIIDDGAHTNDTTAISFEAMWPHLNSGGLYCIEDLGTAYGGDPFFQKPGFPNQMDSLKAMIDQINLGEGQVDSIYFSQELAIVRKK